MAIVYNPMISWRDLDTVLLDMDGTLLDLRFDTTLWMQLLPIRYAQQTCQSPDLARKKLFAHMDEIHAKLDYYCIDYWSKFTGLDILALHHELAHLITYRSGAEAFLNWLGSQSLEVFLVTNAHRTGLQIKSAALNLDQHLDGVISAHDYHHPKESQAFWQVLESELSYDKNTTLLIDDNIEVLSAAETHGIRHLLCIHRPDSLQPIRQNLAYPAIDTFADIGEFQIGES